MENLNVMLSPYGSIASIFSILIVLIGFSRKKLKAIKQEKLNLEERFNQYKSEINRLAKNAGTTAKRQDLFMYINETLSSYRHYEMKMRLESIARSFLTGILLFLSIGYSFYIVKSLDVITFKIVLFPAFIVSCSIYMAILCFKINTLLNQQHKITESISTGYLDAVREHIDKTIA